MTRTVCGRRCVHRLVAAVMAPVVTTGLAACGGAGDEAAQTPPPPSAGAAASPSDGASYPDVVDVTVRSDGTGYTFDATISSPYDSPERYADAFRVRTPDGTVLGVRELTHPHQDEQPFTRSLSDVEVPDDVDRLIVEGRDLVNGWGGATVAIDRSELPGAS